MEQITDIAKEASDVIKSGNIIQGAVALVKKHKFAGFFALVAAALGMFGIIVGSTSNVIEPTIEPQAAFYQKLIVDSGSSNITVTMGTEGKKQFLADYDNENRVNLFSKLGAKKEYTVTYSGDFENKKLDSIAVGYVGNREAYPIETPEHYAVSLNLKIYVGEAKHVFVSNGTGIDYIENAIVDGYLNTSAFYAIADGETKTWTAFGETQMNGTTDEYVYYELQNENFVVIDSFFYRAVYNFTFSDTEVKN